MFFQNQRKALSKIIQISVKIFFRKSPLCVKLGNHKTRSLPIFCLLRLVSVIALILQWTGPLCQLRLGSVSHEQTPVFYRKKRFIFPALRGLEVGRSRQIGSSIVTKDPHLFYLYTLSALPHGIYAQSFLMVKRSLLTLQKSYPCPTQKRGRGTRVSSEASQMSPSPLKSFSRSQTQRLLFTAAEKCHFGGLKEVSTLQQLYY